MIEKNAEKETFFHLYFDKLYKLVNENGFMSVAKSKKLEIIAIGIFLLNSKNLLIIIYLRLKIMIIGVNNLLIF